MRKAWKLGCGLAVGVGAIEALPAFVTGAPKPFDFSLKKDFMVENMVKNHFQFRSLAQRFLTDQIVLHHSGASGSLSTAVDVHRLHLKRGWSGIGYHFFIRRDGTVETGRPLEDVGAHAYGYNDNTVGICLAGNFDVETPTERQFAAAAKVVGTLCRLYDLQPNDRNIIGRCDLNATDCPGTQFYPRLYALSESAAKLL